MNSKWTMTAFCLVIFSSFASDLGHVFRLGYGIGDLDWICLEVWCCIP